MFRSTGSVVAADDLEDRELEASLEEMEDSIVIKEWMFVVGERIVCWLIGIIMACAQFHELSSSGAFEQQL